MFPVAKVLCIPSTSRRIIYRAATTRMRNIKVNATLGNDLSILAVNCKKIAICPPPLLIGLDSFQSESLALCAEKCDEDRLLVFRDWQKFSTELIQMRTSSLILYQAK